MKRNVTIPIGMALVAVEVKLGERCKLCFLENVRHDHLCLACSSEDRIDGKNVIFKLTDLAEDK